MKELPVNLDILRKEDTYSVATALLYTLRNSPKYSTMSELFYLLDYQSFLNLIEYFGGQVIRVPSSEEISEMLKILLLYQYRVVEEISWEDSLKKAGIPQEESISARNKLNSLVRVLKTQNLGDRSYE